MDNPPSLVFTSTNKVYGNLCDLALQKNGTRYQPLDSTLRSGISEDRPLDFHSPYGCSKGQPTNMCSILRARLTCRPLSFE